MAQETIRLNCTESTYIDRNNEGNLGKTAELKAFSEDFVAAPFQIRNIAFLKFEIPEEVKKYKILSCKLHMNATIAATYDEFGGYYYTNIGLSVSSKEFRGENGIYDIKRDDFLLKGKGEDQDYTRNTRTTSADAGLTLKEQYPNFTNFTFDLLTTKDTKVFTAANLWENFRNFYKTGIVVVNIDGVGGTWNDSYINQSWMYSYATIQSSRTSSAPYIEVVIDKDYLSLSTINTGFVDSHRDFLFKWAIAPELHLFDPMTTQRSAQFRLRKKGGESVLSQDIAGNTPQYTLKADTLDTGAFEWQVTVIAEDGRTATSDWKEFTTQDALSKATNPLPNQVTLDGSQENIFRWNHLISTNSKPRGFEIQYRSENAVWKTLVDNQNTDDTFYIIPANTLPAGNLEWKVRTYNSNLAAGEWSETSSIIVRSAPPTPIITSVTSNPRPTIVWQAEGQVQAEIKVGEKIQSVLSVNKSHRWEEFLPDGSATVSVRVKNRFNLWSQWAQGLVIIQNQPVGQVEALSGVEKFSVVVSAKSQFPANYLYRDGELIGKMKAIKESEGIYKYIDDTVLGAHTYYVLGVDAKSNYQRSEEIKASVQVPFGIISERGTQNWVELKKRRGAFPMHTITKKRPVSMVYYAGKLLPVAHVADELGASHALEFTTDKQTADRVEALVGKNIIYKDVRGDLVEGILTAVECNRDRATDIKLEIGETQQEVTIIE